MTYYTGWTVRRSNPGGGEIFRTRQDWPWGPPRLLCNSYRVSFPEVKRPERGANHPPPSSAEVKERVELCLCSPTGPSWPALGRTSPLPKGDPLHVTNDISLLEALTVNELRFI
jgi:hypothetical protein